MRRKPIVGEVLFDLNIGNRADRHRPQKLTPVTVIAVGRKYFTCAPNGGKDYPQTDYHLSYWMEKTKYSRGHQLYESPEDWEIEKEAAQTAKFIMSQFDHFCITKCALSISQLRAIKAIIESSTPPTTP